MKFSSIIRITYGCKTKIIKRSFWGLHHKLLYHYAMVPMGRKEIRKPMLPWNDTDDCMQMCLRGMFVGIEKKFINLKTLTP